MKLQSAAAIAVIMQIRPQKNRFKKEQLIAKAKSDRKKTNIEPHIYCTLTDDQINVHVFRLHSQSPWLCQSKIAPKNIAEV